MTQTVCEYDFRVRIEWVARYAGVESNEDGTRGRQVTQRQGGRGARQHSEYGGFDQEFLRDNCQDLLFGKRLTKDRIWQWNLLRKHEYVSNIRQTKKCNIYGFMRSVYFSRDTQRIQTLPRSPPSLVHSYAVAAPGGCVQLDSLLLWLMIYQRYIKGTRRERK